MKKEGQLGVLLILPAPMLVLYTSATRADSVNWQSPFASLGADESAFELHKKMILQCRGNAPPWVS